MEALAAAAAAREEPQGAGAAPGAGEGEEFVLPRNAPITGYIDEAEVQRASLQQHLPEVRRGDRQGGGTERGKGEGESGPSTSTTKSCSLALVRQQRRARGPRGARRAWV